jgi:hypothetical protein
MIVASIVAISFLLALTANASAVETVILFPDFSLELWR